MIRHPHVKLYHLKPQTLTHAEIIKVLDKLTYDTSFESSWLGDHRFWILPCVSGTANNISEKLTGRKPVRNEATSERGYCRIISVARAIARDYWYYPQYPILFSTFNKVSFWFTLVENFHPFGAALLRFCPFLRITVGAHALSCLAQLKCCRPFQKLSFWIILKSSICWLLE